MKKAFFFSFAIHTLLLCTTVHAQSYNAMILSLDGNGVLTRGSEEIRIDLPQSYLPGDELSIQNGNAIIMLFSGEEIPLSAVSYYTIPNASSANISAISAMANTNTDQNLLSQSGAAYQIRGKSNVFPMNSKASSTENIALYLNYKNIEEQELDLQVINSVNQKIIFEEFSINDSIVSLKEVPFEQGKSYYWTINNTPTGKPEMGTIIVSGSADKTQLMEVKESHFENINAISELYNNKYYFDAYVLINSCIKTYPSFEIYLKLRDNLLLE